MGKSDSSRLFFALLIQTHSVEGAHMSLSTITEKPWLLALTVFLGIVIILLSLTIPGFCPGILVVGFFILAVVQAIKSEGKWKVFWIVALVMGVAAFICSFLGAGIYVFFEYIYKFLSA